MTGPSKCGASVANGFRFLLQFYIRRFAFWIFMLFLVFY